MQVKRKDQLALAHAPMTSQMNGAPFVNVHAIDQSMHVHFGKKIW